MLTLIKLKDFKAFMDIEFPFKQLTLLTGLNSSGKSSILHALLLINQSISEDKSVGKLLLNGYQITLGNVSDVTNEITGQNGMEIGIQTEEAYCQWKFESEDRRQIVIPLKEFILTKTDGMTVTEEHTVSNLEAQEETLVKNITQVLHDLVYIGAERIGPREVYTLNLSRNPKDVGKSGEKTAGVLYWQQESLPHPELRIEGVGHSLPLQVNAWMDRFFPGAFVEVSTVLGSNLVSLGLRANKSSPLRRPQNVGYGLTHVLPIITACLVAEPGDLLLIENPEAHLHPAGQSQMGQFLAQAVRTGVQLIMETHSDHVLNGVRRYVRENGLDSSEVAIYFFNPPKEDEQPQVISIGVNPDGSLDSWPNGFFDQIDKDLMELSGWGE